MGGFSYAFFFTCAAAHLKTYPYFHRKKAHFSTEMCLK